MAYSLPPPNVTNGTAALENLIIYEAGQVPILIPGILFLIMFVIAGGGYYSQERRNGRGNFLLWFSIGSFITTVLSFILFLIPGMLSLPTVLIFFLIMVVSVTLYLVFD